MSVVPPGFKRHRVPGDGNCFYYSLSLSMSAFETRWGAEQVNEFKKKLSTFAQHRSEIMKDLMSFPEQRMPFLKHLATPGSWAGNMEISLAAEYYDICVYTFQYLSTNKWLVQSFLPTDRMDVCYQSGVFDSRQISERYFCEEACGDAGPIYILHSNDNHYDSLEKTGLSSRGRTRPLLASEERWASNVQRQRRHEADPKMSAERRIYESSERRGPSPLGLHSVSAGKKRGDVASHTERQTGRISEGDAHLLSVLSTALKLLHRLSRTNVDVELIRMYEGLIRDVQTFLTKFLRKYPFLTRDTWNTL